MRPLEPRDRVVVTAEHEGGRREELEILGVERRLGVRLLEALVRMRPGSRSEGLPAPLELVGPITHAAPHCAPNLIAECPPAACLSRPP